jgi:hypothetical protein
MRHGFLKLRFSDDGDGTGKLLAQANVQGFAGVGGAYFNIDKLKEFAAAISKFPLGKGQRCGIASGFASRKAPHELEQEHLGIDVYPINVRGYIGIQVRTATELRQGMRSDSQKSAKLEIITTYEPLAKFSRELLLLLDGTISEAMLEGEQIT